MEVRFAVTVMPVLVAPGVTATLSSVLPPGSTPAGVAVPTPESCPATGQVWTGAEELRGSGATSAKSLALLLVSVQPLYLRRTPVVLPGAGAGEVSEQVAVEP